MAKIVHLNGQRPGGWAKGRWDWMRQVRRCSDLSPMARLVAQALAQGFSNAETGECRPGAQALADDCGTGVRTIGRALAELEAAGWIERLGGNSPGIRAALRFKYPTEPKSARRFASDEHPTDLTGEHPTDLTGEHPTDLTGEHPTDFAATPDRFCAPPRPPYKDKPNMNQKDASHPVAKIRGLPMPQCVTTLIAKGSEEAAEWSAWLVEHGFPELGRIGHEARGAWVMPLVRAPRAQDEIPHRVAVSWANWLVSKPLV